ncbi:methyltransferase family protein [Fodinicola feengrottensis]|uniref:Isoprenylcysteine carboxylmethyltransferase family protein n=1 Tax=Fodinicola feengrottensis TaxID=435914 RepID=A0ABN2GBE7_9ACTN|nr:isoprenylcysteine carboxylmethyltransferase family protein [Fodinicola feengrottensis]
MIERLLRCYPPRWRDRYGREVGWLVTDLIEAGELTPVRAGLDLVVAAAAAWWQVIADRAVLLRLCAVLVIGGGLALLLAWLAPAGPIGTYVGAHPGGLLVLLIQVGWLVTEAAEFRRGRRSRHWREGPRPNRSTYWCALSACVLAGTAVINLAPVAIQVAAIRPGMPVQVAGAALILAGTALRERAFRALGGRYCSFAVKVTADQPIVSTGPYRLLRHPGHAGMLLACAGVGALTANWVAIVTQVLLSLTFVVWCARVEENAMLAALGDRYRDYAASRKRLVPLLW